MKRAIIGHTGFVGSNIIKQLNFDSFYNSKNIECIKNQEYDEIYCSATPAEKWKANKETFNDLKSICILIDSLREVKCNRFVLISTVDVYNNTVDVNENSSINLYNHNAYGTHRRLLELFIIEKFKNHNIIRLPALFGNGLKKNIIYDFINNNDIHKIHSKSIFQFYSLDSLVIDIKNVINNNIQLMNMVTEPISVKKIAEEVFNLDFNNMPNYIPANYNIKTNYADKFGRKDYIQSSDDVINKLINFIK